MSGQTNGGVFNPRNLSLFGYTYNNPINLVDPNGELSRDAATQQAAKLNENGFNMSAVYMNPSKGTNGWEVSNSEMAAKISSGQVYNPSRNPETNKPIIDNTIDAVNHYYNGNGESVELGKDTQSALKNSSKVQRQINAIKNDTAKKINGNLEVDLTNKIYHVGKTRVNFTTKDKNDIRTITFTGFLFGNDADGFSDANPVRFGDDRKGPNNELGGKPYDYTPYSWSVSFPLQNKEQ